jgi:DUF4097 and DUF4098 domain-containing protein YvlB
VTRVRIVAAAAVWAACGLVVAAAPQVFAGQRTEVIENHEAALSKGDRARVTATSGSISVTASPDSMLRVVARKVVEGGTAAERDSVLANLRVRFETRDGTVLVSEVRSSSWDGAKGAVKRLLRGGFGGAHGWIDFDVRLPRGTRFETDATSGAVSIDGTEGEGRLATTSGEITVRRTTGSLDLSATSGNIDVTETTGDVEVSLTSGDLTVERANGSVEATLTSGEADLRGVGGAVTLSATSGDARLAACSGPIDVSLTSGGVEVDGSAADVTVESSSGDVIVSAASLGDRGIEVESTSGSVRLTLPSSAGARLNLRTTSGTIRTDGRVSVTGVSRRRLNARVDGSGSAPVSVRTTSGDIEVLVDGRKTATAASRRGETKP